ncbi:efflux RND transporter permease subunit, partial [Salmonella enterica subsp. enterica serovar Kentucky]|nr:efflux RND transporter permease subunit [Salmonella enterica subsp. enterica serovar Kentucky]
TGIAFVSLKDWADRPGEKNKVEAITQRATAAFSQIKDAMVFALSEKPRGFHLITDEIIDKLSGLPPVETGLLHLLLLHTSASLT